LGRSVDRLEAMSVLVAATEAGSLSAAARKLGRPLTTISRKILELEAHLNVQLLNRSSRKLSLTEAGRDYVASCRRILDDVGEAERSAAGEYSAPTGDLTITAPLIFGRLCVIPILAEFLQAYPGISVQLLLADRIFNLFDEQVDLAIRVSKLPDSSLVATKVGSSRRVVCGSPSYFATRGIPGRPAEIRAHDCITFAGWMSPEVWTFGADKSCVSVAIQSRLVVNTAEAALDAAIAGIGITCALSYQIADAVEAGALAVILKEFEPEPVPVSIVYAAGRRLPHKLRAFCSFAAPRLKKRLSGTLV
jgi:DNA-binding transcriptional LysR family regulator